MLPLPLTRVRTRFRPFSILPPFESNYLARSPPTFTSLTPSIRTIPAASQKASFTTHFHKQRAQAQHEVNMGRDDKKKKPSFALKTPKGTRDWSGTDMVIRESIFKNITEVFKRHGAVTIDTPVFELREILAGKYGEDSKLIYDLADQGGEICSLRYDLTISFARWIAMNPSAVPIRRYQLGKVYRRDQPQLAKGRMREFWQCDFDIAGEHDPMIPDAEILRITTEIFGALGWDGRYIIKLNNRLILDGIFQVCGVPQDKLRSISSAVDKLDKAPWSEVKREMTEEKGLDPEVADKIWSYVQHKGSKEVLEMLKADEAMMANASAKKGVEDMLLLASYLESFGMLDKVSIDMSLARGLDYYTGVIYEVVAHQGTSADSDQTDGETSGVGSVAAGGRYDGLVGMFSGREVPCVGISFGVERIFSIMKARLEKDKNAAALIRPRDTDIYVMAFGGKGFTGLLPERMAIARELWDAGIKAEFAWKAKPKLPAQFKEAESGMIPFCVILGEDELAAGKVKIKEMGLPDGHPEKDGVVVEKSKLVEEVKTRLAKMDNQSLSAQFAAATIAEGVPPAT